jgi:hypothetical protein
MAWKTAAVWTPEGDAPLDYERMKQGDRHQEFLPYSV